VNFANLGSLGDDVDIIDVAEQRSTCQARKVY
jgi:hypothetical protein